MPVMKKAGKSRPSSLNIDSCQYIRGQPPTLIYEDMLLFNCKESIEIDRQLDQGRAIGSTVNAALVQGGSVGLPSRLANVPTTPACQPGCL